MNLKTQELKKKFQAQPQEVVATVIANNSRAVGLMLKGYTGQIVNNADDMADVLEQVCRMYPDQADKIVYNVLNVPIIEQNLTPVGKDWVLDEMITTDAMLKNMIWDPSIDELNQELGVGQYQDNTEDTTDTNSTGSFNWGPIIQNALPGILAVFGINQNQNPNSAAPRPQNNRPTINWIWILVLLVIVIAVIIVIARANKK